jgi:hypothetical protein
MAGGFEFSILSFLYVYFYTSGWRLTSHALFTIQDDAGWVCQETGKKSDLHVLGLGKKNSHPI